MKQLFYCLLSSCFFYTAALAGNSTPAAERAPGIPPAKLEKSGMSAFGKKFPPQKNNNYSKRLVPGQKSNLFTTTASANLWNLQFKYDVTIGSGVETNGSNFYVSQWNSGMIYVFSMNGTPLDSFLLNGISGIRDLAFDGSYFYGSNAASVIYKMDLVNHLLLDSIVCPSNVTVRHIAYDNVNDAFYVGDWNTDIFLVNRNGQVIGGIQQAKHQMEAMYGSAFDNITPGGPYLWVSNQAGNGCDIVMLKISTGLRTGIMHDSYEDAAENLFDPIIGGLFIRQNIIAGTATLGGIMQGQRIFGFDLGTLVAQKDVGIEKIVSPVATGCSLGSAETVTVLLRNYGLTTAGNFNVNMTFNNNPYSISIPGNMNSFDTLLVSFPGTFNMASPDVYKMKIHTSLSTDNNAVNDTLNHRIVTGNGLMTVNLLTDGYPEETYWEIYNLFDYEVVGHSLPTENAANTYYSTDVCVDTNSCYSFALYDSYGDGISDSGYFEVLLSGSPVVYEDSFTTDYFQATFLGHCDYTDVGISGILNPVSSCYLGNEEFVSILVKNFGTRTVYAPEVTYSVNGTTVTEQMTDSLQSLEEIEYMFVNFADLSALGNYALKVHTTYSNDANPLNDSLLYAIENYTPAQPPYAVDFDVDSVNGQLLVIDENTDGYTWALIANGGMSNTDCAYYTFNQNEPANDWLFSKCLDLTQGINYAVEFYYKVQGASYPENLKVQLSRAPSIDAVLEDTLINLYHVTDTGFTKAAAVFTVNESGTYYVGLNVYSDAGMWNFYVDNLSVAFPAGLNSADTKSDGVSLYPNPTDGMIRVISENTMKEILITDMLGKTLAAIPCLQKNSFVDVSGLKAGMYMVIIKTEKETANRKIVIE